VNDESRVSILVICTANRFRSPLAAGVIAAGLRGLPFRVASRGMLDVGPLPPLLLALECGRDLGVDLSRHRARQLQRDDLDGADVVLGFEAQHLQAARETGAAEGALFTLVDAVALLARTDRDADPRERFAAADALRERDAAPAEIDDPITKPRDEALAIGRRVHTLSVELVDLLRPSSG
jgi:protein-tyrosine-phosphatase